MKIYSATTNAFYAPEFQSDYEAAGTWPADGIEVSDDDYNALMTAQSTGQVIAADANGYPVAVNPPPPTAEETQAQVNAEARAYLASTDWYIIRQGETGEVTPPEILTEREAARGRVVETPDAPEATTAAPRPARSKKG